MLLKYSKQHFLNGDSPNQHDTQTGEISDVMVNSSSILLTSTNIKLKIMKRKFQHYAINAFLISLGTLAATGIITIIFHLAFNNPTITFGGW